MSRYSRSLVTAVLGPTNTGKTHLAVERMLGHSSGMIGFPLRLLAREVYDRVVAARGAGAAALVTGEERIWPETARYILCTAEAMPMAAQVRDERGSDAVRDVAFVALDEAQMGQDRERGHVFTSRLLHARGREETMILGSGSLAPLVRSLIPEAEILARPRFSTLSYDGPKKLNRLPPRTAIVAFSAEEVYAIAEAIRRFSGGAAVVMGALSPRTRNAQVAMFQAGEVDYLVATDAIGMGLNLDVGHVAFASLNKFDGIRQRRLTLPEMAQIAGRAGRHQRDGTFGSVGSDTAFSPEEIEQLEGHRFAPLDWLYWRNPSPATDTIAQLIAGLEAPPSDPMLRPAPEASDLAVLRRLQTDLEATDLVNDRAGVERFWSACSLPDFRKAGVEAHARFVARIWRDLGRGNGHIDADWFAGQMRKCDDSTGSVEQIADRIAAIRSYCYMAHRGDWLDEPDAMVEATQAIEARLSDAMHLALTARFVDRRTAVLLRGLAPGAVALPVAVADDGAVTVDGEVIGTLDGFSFRVDPVARAGDRRLLLAAAEKHLSGELVRRAMALATADDAALSLLLEVNCPPTICWQDQSVATLVRGKARLMPQVHLAPAIAALDAHVVTAVIARLDRFVDAALADHLAPLTTMAALARSAESSPALRTIFAGIVEGGGQVARDLVDEALKALTPEERHELALQSLKIGTLDVFSPALVKPGAMRWMAALDGAWRSVPVAPPPDPGITLIPASGEAPPVVAGYRRINDWWLRVDLVERIARHAHQARMAALEASAAGNAPIADPDHAADNAGEAPSETASETAPETAPEVAPTAKARRTRAARDTEGKKSVSFQIDPELARSIGLPLADRLAILRLLGFRTLTSPGPVSVDQEPDLHWIWRGRAAARQAAQPAPDKRKRSKHQARRGAYVTDKPIDPANNPFAALAGLFDRKPKS